MNDKNLLQQLQSPETRTTAFETLVKTYQRPLYYHIRRIVQTHDDTDDILQNTFVSAWRHIEKFRGDSSLKTWLYRIATNESITFLNAQKKQAKQDIETMENVSQHSTSGHNQVESDTILRKLQEAISLLPEKQRLVFNMRYYDELSFKEIAEILDISEGGLKANYHHAAKKIEAFLTGKELLLD